MKHLQIQKTFSSTGLETPYVVLDGGDTVHYSGVADTTYKFTVQVQDFVTHGLIESKEYSFTPSNSEALTITIEDWHNYLFANYQDENVTKYGLTIDQSTGKILSNNEEIFTIEGNVSIVIYRITMS